MKRLLLIACVVCSVAPSLAQGSLDSLKKELVVAKHDSVRTKLKCLIGTEEFVERVSFWDSLIVDAKKWKLPSTEALANLNVGYLYLNQGKNAEAEVTWKEAMRISEKNNNYDIAPAAANNLAYLYEQQGAIPKALDFYFKSLVFLDRAHNEKDKGSIYNNLASIYFSLGDFEKTYEYSEKSITLRQKLKDSVDLAKSLNNMGYYLQAQKEYAPALAYYERALLIIKKLDLKGILPNTYYNIGTILAATGNPVKALEKLDESLELYRKNGNKMGQSNSLAAIAEIEMKAGNYAGGIKKAEEALELGKALGYPDPIRHASKVLYEGYKASGNKAKALEMHELFIVMKDSIAKEENHKASIQKQMKYTFDNLAAADSIKNAEKIKFEQQKHEQEIQQQKMLSYGGVIGFLLMLMIAGISFRAFKNKQKANIIIEEQKQIVEEKQKEIVDSINYAKRIQYAMLAHDDLLKKNLGEHFVFFNPKAIVSGDFYWATKKEDRFYLAVCDSTGHGVPGAFMSLLNISFLNEAITEKNITAPNEIFDHVRRRLIEKVSQDGAQDGMDGILICFEKGKITYAAAHNPPLIIQEGELHELKYDKMPIGKGEKEAPFNLYHIDHKKGDLLYFYTDGYADQFGGKNGKKFKYKQLQQLILANSGKPMQEQKEVYEKNITEWRGNLEQVDDILMIGIHIS
ncbi:MAG TPA: tetratricopeptide repeat protein [Bacteroidia bacterium]|jgi:serine phosphatase RsbU (regulator of sigma subunit)/Tfp pilus assembly protein PilF